MNGSLKIARVAGIGIYLHWTFLLLLGWLYFSAATVVAGLELVGLVVAVFGCVALHELGHALTARAYGVRTLHITLLPIGGIARLERIPQGPWQEFWVAVAGPAVNVAIAAALLGVMIGLAGALAAGGAISDVADVEGLWQYGGGFLATLLATNIALVLFNMLPAFPMDGGRVLRSLLALRMSRLRATQIAANVGRFMALLFIAAGLLTGRWMLVFIAMFVFMAANGELQVVKAQAAFRKLRVRDVMTKVVLPLEVSDTLQHAAEEVLAGYQHDFPVVQQGQLIGMLHREALAAALEKDAAATVQSAVCYDCRAVQPDAPLSGVVQQMQTSACPTLPVVIDGEIVGLLPRKKVDAWAAVQ